MQRDTPNKHMAWSNTRVARTADAERVAKRTVWGLCWRLRQLSAVLQTASTYAFAGLPYPLACVHRIHRSNSAASNAYRAAQPKVHDLTVLIIHARHSALLGAHAVLRRNGTRHGCFRKSIDVVDAAGSCGKQSHAAFQRRGQRVREDGRLRDSSQAKPPQQF